MISSIAIASRESAHLQASAHIRSCAICMSYVLALDTKQIGKSALQGLSGIKTSEVLVSWIYMYSRNLNHAILYYTEVSKQSIAVSTRFFSSIITAAVDHDDENVAASHNSYATSLLLFLAVSADT